MGPVGLGATWRGGTIAIEFAVAAAGVTAAWRCDAPRQVWRCGGKGRRNGLCRCRLTSSVACGEIGLAVKLFVGGGTWVLVHPATAAATATAAPFFGVDRGFVRWGGQGTSPARPGL